jgi:hypothetical protein
LISLFSSVSCTLTAARKPPNANEKALTNVRIEFAVQKMHSITCSDSTNSEEKRKSSN